MSPLDTLHGLTLNQLEAIRGYSDTINALASAAREADTIKEPCSVFAIQGMMRALKSVRSVGADNDRPYGDGTRFAFPKYKRTSPESSAVSP